MNRRAFLGLAGLTGYGAWALGRPCPPNNPHCPPTTTTTTTTLPPAGYAAGYDPGY